MELASLGKCLKLRLASFQQEEHQDVNPDVLPVSEATPVRSLQGRGQAGLAIPTIAEWSVVGHDRIVGVLQHGTSAAHGKTIITSPIVRVRLADGEGMPVAHTQSGSRYALAAPGPGFGTERAQQFVRFKGRVPISRDVPAVEAGMQTGLLKLPS